VRLIKSDISCSPLATHFNTFDTPLTMPLTTESVTQLFRNAGWIVFPKALPDFVAMSEHLDQDGVEKIVNQLAEWINSRKCNEWQYDCFDFSGWKIDPRLTPASVLYQRFQAAKLRSEKQRHAQLHAFRTLVDEKLNNQTSMLYTTGEVLVTLDDISNDIQELLINDLKERGFSVKKLFASGLRLQLLFQF
jgi:hypothetical protein